MQSIPSSCCYRHISLVLASEFWNIVCISLSISHCAYLTIILVISKSDFQIKQFFPSVIAMKIALGKSKLSEVILISSVVFDEVPAHQKSTLRDTETSVSAQTFKIPGGPHGTEGVQPESSHPSTHWSLGWGPKSCQNSGCLAGALPVRGHHCWDWAEQKRVRAWLKLDRKGPIGAHFPQEKPWVERIQSWVASSQRLPTL